MATQLGRRSDRLVRVRALKTTKGRREQRRFIIEGPTLLDEALRGGAAIEELYVTQDAYDGNARARDTDARGTPTYIVDDRTLDGLSDVDTPTGILAVASVRTGSLESMSAARAGLVLALADVSDPGNAGTLLRSAHAFGVPSVIFTPAAVDPYLPKVVRAAMGALFHLEIIVAAPDAVAAAAAAGGYALIGLAHGGAPLDSFEWPGRAVLVVGAERHGLGAWDALCERRVGIPMPGGSESLNAAVAGSIALYEACKSRT